MLLPTLSYLALLEGVQGQQALYLVDEALLSSSGADNDARGAGGGGGDQAQIADY